MCLALQASGVWTVAPLSYAAKFDTFLSLDCARVEGVRPNFAIWQHGLFQARKREAKEQKNRQRQRRANSIGAFRSSNATDAAVGAGVAAAAAAPVASSDDLDAVMKINTFPCG